MTSHRVRAHNTATESANKIHDDAVARSLGFRGGLVPGVDVYAYLCHVPAEHWGDVWVERGAIAAQLLSPVYDGDDVEVRGDLAGDDRLELELVDSAGTVCATAIALSRAPVDAVSVDPRAWPSGPVPVDPPPASATALTERPLGSIDATFHSDRAGEYLDDIREQLPLFRSGSHAHPGWLLRFANYVLSRNVRLGPWIHVASDVRFASAVRDGDNVETRARVERVWEAKGHELIALDVLQVVGDRVVARVAHTAIFRPRGTGADQVVSEPTTGRTGDGGDEPAGQPGHDDGTSSPTASTTS